MKATRRARSDWAVPAILVVIALWAACASGKMAGGGTDQYVVPIGETLEEDVYVGARGVSISGVLDGDLFAWAQSITVDGTVTQDLVVLAETVRINGEVSDDVRVGCHTLEIAGTVRGDVMVGASEVRILEGAVIEGDLLAGCGTIAIDGTIGGFAKVASGIVSMDGSIGEDATFMTDGGITLGEGAHIGGDLTYKGPAEIEFRRGAVSGAIIFEPKTDEVKAKLEGFDLPSVAKVVLHVLLFIAAIVTGSILIALTSDHARRTSQKIGTKPLKSLGIGFIAFICIPVVALIALVLIVTIPLSFILVLGYLVAVYIAKFYVAIWVGNLILRRGDRRDLSPVPPMLLGLIVLYILTAIPVAGVLISFLIIFLGLGALLQRKETRLNGAFESAPAETGGLPNGFPGAPAEA